jgi:death on curing protein
MIFLDQTQIESLQRKLIDETGGAHGIRDVGAVESAIAQPRMMFGGADLYPTIEEKAAALAFSLIKNHPFIDGNKRIGLAAAALFLRANGYDFSATTDELEDIILRLAASELTREEWNTWVRDHVIPFTA